MRPVQSALALAPMAWALAAASPAAPPAASEYQVKAAFLLNFARYVEWPAEAFRQSDAPFVIGILGRDPFGPALDELVRGEAVAGRPVEVRRLGDTDAARRCQIVFIAHGMPAAEIVERLAGEPVLTVGDDGRDSFTDKDGMISLFLEGNKVRFEINAQAAERSGLKISSRLLRLAKLTPPGRRPR